MPLGDSQNLRTRHNYVARASEYSGELLQVRTKDKLLPRWWLEDGNKELFCSDNVVDDYSSSINVAEVSGRYALFNDGINTLKMLGMKDIEPSIV